MLMSVKTLDSNVVMTDHSQARFPQTVLYIGAVLTMLSTLLLFRLFFGAGMLSHPSQYFFSVSSYDLIKDVYNTTYHTRYDSSLIHCTSMAYPYGEHHTYTGLQVLVSAPLQLLQKMGVHDAWKACLTLINLYVILSILLCSLFLYLLFLELKIPPFPSAFGAVFITFLMPQLMRVGGHLTLSYLCVIPMALYFIARLHGTRHWKWSVFYGVLLLLSTLAHPYYGAFLADISIVYLLYLLFSHKKNRCKISQVGLYFLLQFVLPVVLFFILANYGDTATDRTAVADGMYLFRGRMEGLLLPFHRLLMIAPLRNWGINPPQWETLSYVGVVALIAFVVWIVRILWDLAHLRVTHLFRPTDNPVLNVFLWASVLLTLVATVLPVITRAHPDLSVHLSALAQLRSLGRMLWLPFVTLNVLAVYWVWQWVSSFRRTGCKIAVLILVCVAYSYEVYAYAPLMGHVQTYPQWTDYDNELSDNQWVAKINSSDYQAILSLPVFHVGSEHYNLPVQPETMHVNTYVSFKTGLPLICVYSARSPITQSYNSVELAWEPWKDFYILEDLPNERPLLIVSLPDRNRLNPNEKRILDYADSLFSTEKFVLYSMPVSKLKQLCQDYQMGRKMLYDNALNDSVSFYFKTWDENEQGMLAATCNKKVFLYDDTINHAWGDSVSISFWIPNYLDDLMGRNIVSVKSFTSDGKATYLAWGSLFPYVTAVDDRAGLVSIPVRFPGNAVRLCVKVGNKHLPTRKVFFDQLLIAPLGRDVAVPYIHQQDTVKLLDNVPLAISR